MGIRLSEKIYAGEDIKNIENISKKIKNDVLINGLYLIYISKNEKNILDIELMYNIIQNKSKDYFVLGISYSKEDAFNIVMLIFKNYINKGHKICDIKMNLINDKW